MKLKNCPYWLKGAIAGLIIFLILFLLSFISLHLGCMDSIISIINQGPEIMFPTPCLLIYFFYAGWFIFLPSFVIIGLIIGLIIQKIKK